MTENSYNRIKSALLIAIVATLAVYLVWIHFLVQRETLLIDRINVLNETLQNLKIRLNENKKDESSNTATFEELENRDHSPSYVDLPSRFPRMINSGVFPLEGNSYMTFESSGRGDQDMNNVGILVESTNGNDTLRLIHTITAQRKSEQDLKIFLYSPTDQSGVTYEMLKSWAAPESNIFAISETSLVNATLNVLGTYSMKYVIKLSDYLHIGDDFSEFYFTGKRVMEVDRSIHAVCGTSNGNWQDKDLGDVLWLSETPCKSGEMISKRSLKFPASNRIWVRPEFSRVALSELSVTLESQWNIERYNPLLMRQAEFSERFYLDMSRSQKRSLEEWLSVRTSGCFNDILMFPYENDEDLKLFFTNTDITAVHKYNGIATLSIDTCRIFIVPKEFFEETYNYN